MTHGVLIRLSPGYPPTMDRLHTCYAPVRRSPPGKASFSRAAPRLACVRPVASVHPEPGSNSSLLYYRFCFSLMKTQRRCCLSRHGAPPRGGHRDLLCSICILPVLGILTRDSGGSLPCLCTVNFPHCKHFNELVLRPARPFGQGVKKNRSLNHMSLVSRKSFVH